MVIAVANTAQTSGVLEPLSGAHARPVLPVATPVVVENLVSVLTLMALLGAPDGQTFRPMLATVTQFEPVPDPESEPDPEPEPDPDPDPDPEPDPAADPLSIGGASISAIGVSAL
jgi:hypothetical protein